MNIRLPGIIAEFLRSKNNYNSEEFVACFTKDAIVQDEGREICGTAAIKKWIEESNEKYHDTVVAQGLNKCGNDTVLSAQVSGDFEGSPVLLNFHFTISEEKISRLHILLPDG